ncbi:MAG TPA: HAD family hydrolase [Methanocorpusculum sp.]|nr:HAD family hydrolase [Methanocorpusculum sp.]
MQTLLTHPFRAVLFDMDNTLFDFVGAMLNACSAAVAFLECGTAEELLGYYLRTKYHFEDNTNLQDFMIAHNCFTVERYFRAAELFDTAKIQDLKPYDGIPEVLSTLKEAGYTLGIVTDAVSFDAEKRLDVCGLKPYFNLCVCYDQVGYKKPHTAPFEEALYLADVMPYEAVFVGDSLRRDIAPAAALGMTPVYAKYGDRNFFETAPPQTPGKTLAAETPKDIVKLLL